MIFVLYLSNDFSLIDIKETAIIVALGIDKEDDVIEVSAQIAVPKTSDQASENPGTVISGKGDTVAIALENIGIRTGWYPKLSFCNVVILGKGVLDGDVMENIDYFIRTAKIQDTAKLCASEKNAKDILTATSPLDELSAFSVTKILQKDAESSSTVSLSSIREFAMGYYSKSGFSLLPMIKTIKIENDSQTKGNQATNHTVNENVVSVSSTPSEEGGNNKKINQIFDATTTLLFSRGKVAGTLEKEQTLAFNLLKQTVNEASIELKGVEYQNKKTNLFLAMRQNFGNAKLKIKNSQPILEINLRLTARLDDTNVTVPPHELVSGYVVPNNVLNGLEEKLTEIYTEIFNKSKQTGCDLFELKDKLYRNHNKYYEGLKNIVIQQTKLFIKIDARSFK